VVVIPEQHSPLSVLPTTQNHFSIFLIRAIDDILIYLHFQYKYLTVCMKIDIKKKPILIGTLLILFLLLITVLFLLRKMPKEKSSIELCIKEGDYSNPFWDSGCCIGLIESLVYEIDESGNCIALTGPNICINCGDGLCKEWENRCNCPDDCV